MDGVVDGRDPPRRLAGFVERLEELRLPVLEKGVPARVEIAPQLHVQGRDSVRMAPIDAMGEADESPQVAATCRLLDGVFHDRRHLPIREGGLLEVRLRQETGREPRPASEKGVRVDGIRLPDLEVLPYSMYS